MQTRVSFRLVGALCVILFAAPTILWGQTGDSPWEHYTQAEMEANEQASLHGGSPLLGFPQPDSAESARELLLQLSTTARTPSRNLLIHSILAGVAVPVFTPVALAQTTARPPGLSGIWMRRRGPGEGPSWFGTEVPPMLPPAKRIYDEHRGGGQIPDQDPGLDELDPQIYCLPHGFPRALTQNYPFEIVQTPEVVYMLFETRWMTRRIYLDGRKMPENYPTSFMGLSTGKYDGDTLVVETVGLNDLTWIDTRGVPHSDALRVTERIRRANTTTLEIDFQFDDPKTFSMPWGDKKTFELKPDWQIMEHIGNCEDRFRYNFREKVFRGTVRWQSPEQAEGKR